MAILVTGGAGYIGSHVVRHLSEAGKEVIVLDNLSSGFREALIYREKLVEGNVGDLKLLDQIFRKHKIEAVMHFAASIFVPESLRHPLKYYKNNSMNTLNLLRACAKNKISKFIFSSTAAVYGVPENGIAVEDAFLNPMNPYGASKLASEWMLRDTGAAHGLKYVVLRYFNAAGADPQARMGQRTPGATHLIKVCCEAALGKREIVNIYGTDYETPDGTCVRDYIHVEDLAKSHLLALDYLDNDGPTVTLNVGYGSGHSVSEVIKIVKEVTGKDFRTVFAGRRSGDPSQLVAKSEKIRKLFNWQPKFASLEKIVEDSFRWESKI